MLVGVLLLAGQRVDQVVAVAGQKAQRQAGRLALEGLRQRAGGAQVVGDHQGVVGDRSCPDRRRFGRAWPAGGD